MSGKRVLLVGATGMVGGIALRTLLERDDVGEVISIGRRAAGVEHPKLEERTQPDLGDYSENLDAFEGVDAAIFCIGAYTGSIPDEEFRRITVDFAVHFGEALYAASPGAALSFLSGQGADPSGKSRMSFARYKGEAESALLALGLSRVHILRPGYIYPVTPRKEPNWSYSLMRGLWPVMRAIYPNLGVSSEDLGRSMARAALDGTGAHEAPVLENKHIRAFAATAD